MDSHVVTYLDGVRTYVHQTMVTRLSEAIQEVLDLDANGVIALPPNTLARLLSLVPDDSDTDED